MLTSRSEVSCTLKINLKWPKQVWNKRTLFIPTIEKHSRVKWKLSSSATRLPQSKLPIRCKNPSWHLLRARNCSSSTPRRSTALGKLTKIILLPSLLGSYKNRNKKDPILGNTWEVPIWWSQLHSLQAGWSLNSSSGLPSTGLKQAPWVSLNPPKCLSNTWAAGKQLIKMPPYWTSTTNDKMKATR